MFTLNNKHVKNFDEEKPEFYSLYNLITSFQPEIIVLHVNTLRIIGYDLVSCMKKRA
jgi:hypothetical protein